MWKVGLSFVCIFLAFTCWLGADGISYEGELSMHGVPADGWFDLRFQIFDQPDGSGAKTLGEEILIPGVQVTGGSFRVEIDSVADLGDRSEIWLEIAVKEANAFGDYMTLHPRQSVNLGNKAVAATKAGTAPLGAVVFFRTAQCPAGWSEYVPARGRYVLGLPFAGTVEGTYGTPLSDLEDRQHSHSFSTWESTTVAGNHNHAWSRIFINPAGDHVWASYNSSGSDTFLVNWGNGVGNEGSGYYPLAATPTRTLYTNISGAHQHDVQVVGSTGDASSYLPYVQLLACQKD